MGFQEMDRIRERLLRRTPSQIEIRAALLPFMIRHIYCDLLYRVKMKFKL